MIDHEIVVEAVNAVGGDRQFVDLSVLQYGRIGEIASPVVGEARRCGREGDLQFEGYQFLKGARGRAPDGDEANAADMAAAIPADVRLELQVAIELRVVGGRFFGKGLVLSLQKTHLQLARTVDREAVIEIR